MLQSVDFAKIKNEEEIFSQSYGLESETLGNHPFIRDGFIGKEAREPLGLKVKILFVKKNYDDAKLNDLTHKIIDSFSISREDYKVVNLDENGDDQLVNFWKKSSADLMVLFETPKEFELVKNGQLKAAFSYMDLEINVAKIWNAADLLENPDLKKTSWALIKHLKSVFS
jgi:hypothetical protein